MLKRAAVLAVFVALIFVVWLIGVTLGGRVRSLIAPTSSTDIVPGNADRSSGHEQVEVTVSSDDVPGCFDVDTPFEAAVRSRWGKLQSENVLTFLWTPSEDSEGAIKVRVVGQTLVPELGVGDSMPDITLNLPLGATNVEVRLTTFVFDRWDESGAACFVWKQPPGTPRRFDFDPGGKGNAA